MNGIGSFISGTVAGVVGLGVVSWLITTLSANNDSQDETESEGE